MENSYLSVGKAMQSIPCVCPFSLELARPTSKRWAD